MKTKFSGMMLVAALALSAWLALVACDHKEDPKAEAPPKAQVVPDLDANNFTVDKPDQFPLATAVEYKAASALNVDRSRAARYRACRSRNLRSPPAVSSKSKPGSAIKSRRAS